VTAETASAAARARAAASTLATAVAVTRAAARAIDRVALRVRRRIHLHVGMLLTDLTVTRAGLAVVRDGEGGARSVDEPLPPRVCVRRTVHLVALLQVGHEIAVQILDITRLRLEIHPAAGREHHLAVVAAVGVRQAPATHPDAVLHDGGAHPFPGLLRFSRQEPLAVCILTRI
jgi:hypothetical protein